MKYGYIYKISYKDLNYYGSSLKKDRFTKHKNKYKSWKEGKEHYVSSFKLFEEAEKNNELPIFQVLGCFYKYFCVECMRKEEQKYIDGNECVNRQNAFITEEQLKELKEKKREYYEKNKEQKKEKMKEHYEKNKEKIAEYKKQYRLKKRQLIHSFSN